MLSHLRVRRDSGGEPCSPPYVSRETDSKKEFMALLTPEQVEQFSIVLPYGSVQLGRSFREVRERGWTIEIWTRPTGMGIRVRDPRRHMRCIHAYGNSGYLDGDAYTAAIALLMGLRSNKEWFDDEAGL